MNEHPDDETAALAQHIALNSRLDNTASLQVVQNSMPANGDVGAKAAAVSRAATAAAAYSGEIKLSDPVMLWPVARAVFAAVCAVVALASCWFIYWLAHESTKPPIAAFVALAVSAGLGLFGLLILVMGYRNVNIQGSA
jgi:hypothetical protein